LVIRSSILKGIKPRGLNDTDVLTFRGSKIDRIADELMKRDLSSYKNIIIHVGGNDIASHGSLRNFEEDYESLLHAARAFVKKGCQYRIRALTKIGCLCS
jgi:hypothetical protein